MGVLEGKNLIVMNVEQGVYFDIVLAAAEEGANVACHVSTRPEDATEAAQMRFMDAFNDALRATRAAKNVQLFAADLSTEEGVEAFFHAVLDQYLDCHGLIYCQEDPWHAEKKPLAELSLEEWNRDLHHQLRTPFLALRQILDEFVVAGGRIVQIAPIVQPDCGRIGYRAAQTALHAFHRSIIKEYGGRNVACNQVLFNRQLIAEQTVAHTLQQPSDEVEDPRARQIRYRSMIELVTFLVSDAASYVNGEVFQLSNVNSRVA